MGKVDKLVAMAIILINCQPSRFSKDSFRYTDYCFTQSRLRPTDLIDHNGYYSFIHSNDLNEWIDNYVFYNNGLYTRYVNIEFQDGLRFGHWGSYYVQGDTVKAQFIAPPKSVYRDNGEIWFKIIDKVSIQRIGFVWTDPMTKDDLKRFQHNNAETYKNIGKFVPYDSLPDSNKSWIMKKEWFWCSK